MKWFKHLSGSLNDDLIFEAIEKFGSDGYLVFFGTLEIMSDEFNINNPGVNRISIKKLTKNFQLSRQKTLKILSFFDQKANENQQKKKSFFVQFEKKHVVVKCNRLAELSDNHTKKLLNDTTKLLQSENEVTLSHRRRSKKKEEDITNKDSKESSSKKQVLDISGNGKCPHQEIINLYHEVLPEMAKIKSWPPTLQKILRTRWKEEPDRKNLAWWRSYFEYVRESPFLMGGKTDFIADLEWIIRPTNMTKIINGRYHSRGSPGTQKFTGIKEWLERKQHEQQ